MIKNYHVWPFQSPATFMAGRESPAHARDQGGLCHPQVWEHQVGEWVLGNVKDYLNVSDGTAHLWNFTDPLTGQSVTEFPAGTYMVRYCNGAWEDAPDCWAVAKEDPTQTQLNEGNRIWVQYRKAGVSTQARFDESTGISPTYAAACAGAAGSTTGLFNHSGGPLQMGFMDLATSDNENAQYYNGMWSNPRYMLVLSQPFFISGNCHALWTQATSPRWTGYFDIGNLSPYSWSGIIIQMRTANGVSNSSSVTLNYTPNQNQSVALTFDAEGPCDPIVDVYYTPWSTTEPWQSFVFHLAPLIVYTGQYTSRGTGVCGPAIHLYATFANNGNMDTTPDCQFSAKPVSGWSGPMQPPGCVPGGQDYVSFRLCCPWGDSTCDYPLYGPRWDYYFHDANPIPPATIEFLVTDGTTVLLDQTVSV